MKFLGGIGASQSAKKYPEVGLSKSSSLDNLSESSGQYEESNNAASPLEPVSFVRACCILFSCIICIAVLASMIIFICTDLAKSLGVDQSTLGATLVALGAEIPDTISAIALSRSGLTHGAISGAIGSQVINISLGVGLPALLLCLTGDGKIYLAKEDTTSLGLLVSLVFVVLLSFMLVTIPIRKIVTSFQVPRFSHLNRYGALMLLFVWMAAFAAFIVLN
jgi:Ca2+/Na+ antiporter